VCSFGLFIAGGRGKAPQPRLLFFPGRVWRARMVTSMLLGQVGTTPRPQLHFHNLRPHLIFIQPQRRPPFIADLIIMSFVGVSTDAYSLPPLLHQVNFRLVNNPLPRSRENTWEHDVRVLMRVGEKDPDRPYKRAKERVEKAREGTKQRIAKFEMEITKKLVKSHAEDAPDRTTQILAYFEPDSRQRAAQILTDFKNARDRHTTESREAAAIDVSTLTPEERYSVASSLAVSKADDITGEVMPWEAALARVNLTNYGVDIRQILAHFKPNSRQQVVAKIFAPSDYPDPDLNEDNGWDRFRADSSPDGDPITKEDPVVAACGLYKLGRSQLSEALSGPIFEGHLLGSDDAPEEYGLLKEGQYTEEHEEYWWIKLRRYWSEWARLDEAREELWRLYVKSKRKKWVKDTDTTAVSQINAGPITRSHRTGRGGVAERPQLQTTSERDRKDTQKAARRKAKVVYRHQHLPGAMSVDVPDTSVMALSPTQGQDKWEPRNLGSVIGRKGNGPPARSILKPVDRLSRDTLQSVESATNNPYTLRPRSKRLPKRKETTTSRKAIHPLRVSKTRKVSGGAQSTELHMKDTRLPPTADRRRNKQDKTLDMSSGPFTSQKPIQQSVSANISRRRSTRISKKPERFYSSYT
jgi:hypothetical protein